MADNLLNLGTTPIFPLMPNWAKTPSTSILMSRKILKQPGTSQVIESVTEDVPQSFTAGFTIFNKEDEYSIVDFFCNRRGKVQRFWVFHPKNMLVLKTEATIGQASIICIPNGFHLIHRGYERIYIKMNDGDTLSRKVFQVTTAYKYKYLYIRPKRSN